RRLPAEPGRAADPAGAARGRHDRAVRRRRVRGAPAAARLDRDRDERRSAAPPRSRPADPDRGPAARRRGDGRNRRLAGARLERLKASVRWLHPTRGRLPPADFLPLAEQTRLIRPLTRWVIERALDDWRRWQEQGLDVGIAVNLSARSLGDEELPVELAMLLAEHGAPPGTLTLELTESAVMADPFRAASILGRLSSMGVRLALDDFGTGYSSLAYLKRLPVDELKIDRSFVSHMGADADDA